MIKQCTALHYYFDGMSETETSNDHVQRVAKYLRDPEVKLLANFVIFYALKPSNIFTTAFQTHTSRIGTLHADVHQILHSFVGNFIDPDVIKSTDNITSLDFADKYIQLSNDELGIGTSTRLLWCGDFEQLVVTALEGRFYECVRRFYETSVSKLMDTFPFHDSTLQQHAFLDPRNRDKTSLNGIFQLANCFTSFSPDELDILGMEF